MTVPKLSIIVPCYNAELFLPRCLESIVAQTLADFECILVDDGSKDATGELCDAMAEKDARFKVIHKPNGGEATARNAGLDVAQGEFIGWVDADDYVEADHFALMVASAERWGTDIVLCDVSEKTNSRILKNYCFPEGKDVLSQKEMLLELLEDRIITSWVWSKIYRRHLFEGERFSPQYRLLVDFEFSHRIFIKASSLSVTRCLTYHYVRREDSLIHGINLDGEWDLLYSVEARYLFFKDSYDSCYSRVAGTRFIKFIRNYLNKLMKNPGRPVRMLEDDCSFFKKYLGLAMRSPIGVKKKLLWLALACDMYPLVEKLRKK